ncbi:MAG: hypothetical protein ACLSVD_12830 [Eggerthellaceae bacterium]
MIGSSKSHIWRIESGRVSVGLDDLGRIAEPSTCRSATSSRSNRASFEARTPKHVVARKPLFSR